jgi:hypothetical protein
LRHRHFRALEHVLEPQFGILLPEAVLLARIATPEAREAIAAFRANREFTPPELYFQRFNEAVAYPDPPGTQGFVLYRLDEIVRDIWRSHPTVIRRFND